MISTRPKNMRLYFIHNIKGKQKDKNIRNPLFKKSNQGEIMSLRCGKKLMHGLNKSLPLLTDE